MNTQTLEFSIQDNRIKGLNPCIVQTDFSYDLTTCATLLVETGHKPLVVISRQLFGPPCILKLMEVHQGLDQTYQIKLNSDGTLLFVACYKANGKGRFFVGYRFGHSWFSTEVEEFRELGLSRFSAKGNHVVTARKDGFSLYKYRGSQVNSSHLEAAWTRVLKNTFHYRKIVDAQFLDYKTLIVLALVEAGTFALQKWKIEQVSTSEVEMKMEYEGTHYQIPVMPTRLVVAESGLCLDFRSSLYLYDYEFKLRYTVNLDQHIDEVYTDLDTVVVHSSKLISVFQIVTNRQEGYKALVKTREKESTAHAIAYKHKVLCEASYKDGLTYRLT